MDQGDDPTTNEPDVDDELVDGDLVDRDGDEPEVEGFAAIVSPRDAASGLPTGKRMHKPFTFGAVDLTPPVPPVPPATPPNPIDGAR